MRVLLTTDTVGGVWTFTRELCSQLLDRGHAVSLVSFGRTPTREQREWCREVEARHERDFRSHFSDAPLEWMSANDRAYDAAAPGLMRIANEFHADLLHTNQFCFGALPIAMPKLITAHSDVLSWAKACRPEGLEPSWWLTRYCEMVGQGMEQADAVAAPTRFMLDALGAHFALPAESYVIPNGRSLPLRASARRRTLQAVSAGRLWDEAKNIAMLAEVEASFPIVIAGEQEYDGACAVHLRGKVLAGSLSEAELLELFQESSIYLGTSIYEPFGLAPLEAALCGCAVVARDIPSMREVWGSAALFFEDAAGLTALLRHLQTSPEALRLAQSRSRVRARQLTATRMAEHYVDIYRGLLSGVSSEALRDLSHAN